MANEKTLNTRVLLKSDTLAKWNSSTLKLKKGEIAIATVAAGEGSGLTEPVCMIKIGEDTEKTFSDLPWSFYAKASDVYAWAKAANKPIYTADEIQGLDEHISGQVQDTNTKYQIVKGKNDYEYKLQSKELNGTWVDVTGSTFTLPKLTKGDDSITIGGTATAPTVAVHLDSTAGNAIKLEPGKGLRVDIPVAAEYSIVKDDNSGDYAAVYHLTKDGLNTGAAINIPKDMVVQSGSVVTNPEGQPAGTYIKLILQNVAEPLYINVGSLIEYVTSGSKTGDMVVVDVSDDHKVTATITDGTITKAKLVTGVQTSLDLADNSVQKEAGKRLMTDAEGIKLEGIATGAQVNVIETVKVNGVALTPDEAKAVDVAVPTGALASKDKIAEADFDTALTAKVSKWDAAEKNAKDYADSLASNYATAAQGDKADSALQGIGQGPNGLGKDEIVIGQKTAGIQTIELSAKTRASLAKADTALQASDISGKADKVQGTNLNGHLAGLDANGNLTDSGKAVGDFVQNVAGAPGIEGHGGLTANKQGSIVTISLDNTAQTNLGLAETSVQGATDGLKVNDNKQVIFDDTYTFIFNCGGAGV